jgi:hypothetical protein
MPCSEAFLVVVYGGDEWVSEGPLVTEESSDDWDAASDQTEAEEEEAEEAIEG